MTQVEYSVILSKESWVYSPTRGGPTAFSVPLAEYLTDMGKQGWDFCRSARGITIPRSCACRGPRP